MSSSNPYSPPAFTVETRKVANVFSVVVASLLWLVAAFLGLVVVGYVFVLGFEWSTPGANVLPSAWNQINIVGISSVCGLITAIMAARSFRRGKHGLLRIILVLFLLAAIANISVAVRKVYDLGQQQNKKI